MTKLLVSVKNIAEARLAIAAEADLIDLKDPEVGALGALDGALTKAIVAEVDGRSITSATVGEQHNNLDDLVRAIDLRAQLGVDIIKIAAGEWMDNEVFASKVTKIAQHLKIVAVFFGDESFDLAWLQQIANMGFYGVMLDTRMKDNSLISNMSVESLHAFIHESHQLGLISGLAGSLDQQHLPKVMALAPDFVGMRGGLCHNGERKTTLMLGKIQQVKEMLLKHNKNACKAQEISLLSLHA